MLKLSDIVKGKKGKKIGKKGKETGKETEGAAARKWKLKRTEFVARCKTAGYSPEGGELANFWDGLTPDGYNKEGKKVGFIEKGRVF